LIFVFMQRKHLSTLLTSNKIHCTQFATGFNSTERLCFGTQPVIFSLVKIEGHRRPFAIAVNGLGCMVKVCGGNEKNELRRCPDADGSCGNYHSERSNGEVVDGVDIRCPNNAPVYAPIDGEMYFWRPFGGATNKACADSGVRIEGTGQWQGYAVHISSITLDFFGGKVKAGEELGKAIDRCNGARRKVEPHVEMKLYREGKLIDPTPLEIFSLHQNTQKNFLYPKKITQMLHLQACAPDKYARINLLGSRSSLISLRYNGVRGWDIECRMMEDEDGGEKRVPLIFSPIAGELVGRTRLVIDQNGAYSGCDNDGMFIVGTGDWIGFEVRLYNVKTRGDLGFGRKRIVQGEPIGSRLDCDNSPDSVFLEVCLLFSLFHRFVIDLSLV
uniref:Peptidase_M23 domain-containing protein n=1 Tax=Angiostrongylus cantonensis TaxID=6313 RepID=A0A0K0DGT4_ANGCA